MSNIKIQKSYIDYGFGFPVKIVNAPLIKIYDEWTLDLNFEKYEKVILLALAMKPACLTGNEIKFIRNHFNMDLKTFGKRFGDVAHSAVIKWEKFRDNITNMNWATEKDIRLAIIEKIKPKILRQVYIELQDTALRKQQTIKIDSSELKAA
jgi:hypothetical protein